MKTSILLFALALVVLFGCRREDNPNVSHWKRTSPSGFITGTFGEITYFGCEYVTYDRSLTHKGNCTNSIHIYNK